VYRAHITFDQVQALETYSSLVTFAPLRRRSRRVYLCPMVQAQFRPVALVVVSFCTAWASLTVAGSSGPESSKTPYNEPS